MFYRLTRINDLPLPATVPMDGRAIPVAGGGLLLEPPTSDGADPYLDGYSILWLHGESSDDGLPDLVIHSSEPYRWRELNQLDISRAANEPCLRLHGHRVGVTLELETESAPCAIGRTRLSFVEAGDEPIPPHWRRETFYGGPRRRVRGAPADADAEMLRRLEYEAAREAEYVRRAGERLVAAWRAGA